MTQNERLTNLEAKNDLPFETLDLAIDTFRPGELPLVFRVLIIHESGLPLFTRDFIEGESAAFGDPLMIGGFISAMATFATTTMASSVTDIGIGTHRLFLLRHRELVFAAIAESSGTPNTRFTSMNEFLHAIAEAFEIVNDIRKVSGTLSAEAAMKFFEKKLDHAILGTTVNNVRTEGELHNLDPFLFSKPNSNNTKT